MSWPSRSRAITAVVALLALAIVAALLVSAVRPRQPLDVVAAWTDARNRGDVDEALSHVADAANLFGMGMHLPGVRERFQLILTAQAAAGWSMDESECTAQDETVRCRYVQRDVILDRWGLELSGRHRYIVRDGKVTFAERVHDADSQRVAYAVFDDFRAWVQETHPELVEVIWRDPSSALYTTPDGAKAVLELVDEYVPPGS